MAADMKKSPSPARLARGARNAGKREGRTPREPFKRTSAARRSVGLKGNGIWVQDRATVEHVAHFQHRADRPESFLMKTLVKRILGWPAHLDRKRRSDRLSLNHMINSAIEAELSGHTKLPSSVTREKGEDNLLFRVFGFSLACQSSLL